MKTINAIRFIKTFNTFLTCKLEPKESMDANTLYGLGITLIFAGMLIIVAAIILLSISSAKREGKVKGGGAIIIGPIPIIFGTDKKSLKTVLLLSLLLTIFLIVATVVIYFLQR
jgi:uncharacterized protein (TIGR00304 family)